MIKDVSSKLPSRLDSELPRGSSPKPSDLATDLLAPSSYSLAKLEKHLADHVAGNGYLSRSGYTYTKQRSLETLDTFSKVGFDGFDSATKLLSSGFTYAKRARIIERLNSTATTAATLADIATALQALKK